MKFRMLLAAGAAAAAVLGAGAANAALVYVGSWVPYIDQAPVWNTGAPDGPLAYTGQEAAALLFGGSAGDYVISTVSTSVGQINNKAWYDVIGLGAHKFAYDHDVKYLGQYYGPTTGFCATGCTYDTNAASALVRDFADTGRNYAFRDDSLGPVTPINYGPGKINTGVGAIPEPATWTLMVGGFGLAGAVMRRRTKVA